MHPKRTFFQNVAVLLCLILLGVTLAYSLEPPTKEQLLKYKKDGTMASRIAAAEALGNHKISPELVSKLKNKLGRISAGRSDYSLQTIEGMPAPPSSNVLPSSGTANILVLLVAFSDYPPITTRDEIASKIFGDGDPTQYPRESLSNYYSRSSYNQLDIQGNVLDWYTTAYTRSAVSEDYAGRESLIKEVLNYYDGQGHDFSQYDNNGDGSIDYLCVFWTGPHGEWASFWWGYYTGFSDTSYTIDGKTLANYSWQWELPAYPSGTFSAMTVIHETGHALGLPDYYDYDGTVGPGGGVGDLDMMDGNIGDHNCFSKFMLDWLTPTIATAGGSVVSLRASGAYPDALLFMPGAVSGDIFNEYFMIQNRYRTENDTGLFTGADGLILWHVDARLNQWGTNYLYNNSNTAHKLLRLQEADGLEEIEALTDRADAGDYYAAGKVFGPQTIPNSNKYDGTSTGLGLGNISATSSEMSVEVLSEFGTVVGGSYTGNITWTAAGGPYIVESSVTIAPLYSSGVWSNSTLTIEAGAIVKFHPGTYLQETGGAHTGTIIVQGTSIYPVYFTSIKDDSVGGDTNGDGSATSPVSGDWAFVRVLNSSTIIHDCVFRYGGYYSATNYGALYIVDSSPTVTGNSFFQNRRGIYTNDASPVLSNNSIENSTYAPICLVGSSFPTYSDNSYVNNGRQAIQHSGTVALNGTWYKESIPYVILDSVTINSAYTVTIPAGAIFKFSTNNYLYVQGILNLQATSADPVYFTSLMDDTVGGDTNNDGVATSPAAGDWGYVRVTNTSNNIHDCVFRYGGRYSLTDYGALYITASSPQVTGNSFVQNRRGIYTNDASPILSNNSIESSTYAPLYLTGSSFPTYSDSSYVNNGIQAIQVSGTVALNGTWYKESIPYVILDSVTINSAYTVTIPAGAIFKFSTNGYLYVQGILNLQATSADPVYFTSLMDDTVGGDTNNDGVATSPAAGDWGYVRVTNANNNIHDCVFRYGGRYSLTDYGALYITASSPQVTGNSFVQNRRGIYTNDASPNLSNNSIENSTYAPICLVGSSFPTYSDSSYVNNGIQAIQVSGTVALNGTWYKESIPYFVSPSVTINSAYTVTVPAGAIFKFSTDDYLYVQGILNLQATSADPVYFTSYRDDTVGGDTNNDGVATSPAAGDWGYVRVTNTNNNIHDCVFRYGGRYSLTDYGALYVSDSSPHVTGNSFVQNRRGIYTNDASPILSNNLIENSTYAPICLVGSSFPTYSDNSYVNNGRQAIQHSGTVALNGTWYKESIPYVILDSVIINSAYTVTIPAGAIFKFSTNGYLYVQGVLSLQGTSADPVYFTSLMDDTVGGDTNNDGVATSPGAGDWGYVRVTNANNNIHDCVFRYGGRYSLTDYGALYVSDSSPQVQNNTFYRNRRGITAQNGSPTLTNNRIESSTYYPVYVYHSSFPIYNGNVYLNNGIQALCLAGTVGANGTWQKDTIPYYVDGSVTIGAAYNVNVPAGTIFKFGASDYLYVQGILNLQSSAASPIYFTSIKDDTVGGDTNSDFGATSPAMGDWGYVRIGNSSNNIHNCIFRYGGIISSSSYGALYVYGSSPTISSNQFSINRSGIYVYNGSPTIQGNVFSQNYNGTYVYSGAPISHDCDFEDNSNYGIYNYTASVINAENCWWGAATGPTHASNPGGTGDRVSDNVDFIPFDGEKNFNSVSGRVKSRNFPWEGIAGVEVSADTEQTAITDSNGDYSISSVPSGDRTISASHMNLDYYATGTSDTASQSVNVSGDVTNINFTDFACKGIALASIEADKTSPAPGDTVNITVSLTNSGMSLTSVISYLDISFSDANVTVGSATGTGWSALDSYPPGSTIYRWDGAGTKTTMTSTDYLISGRRDGSFGNPQTCSFSFPITIKGEAEDGTIITLKFRGTIGDARNPVSGTQDQQGLFVKTLDITVNKGEGIRKDDLVGTWDGQGVYYRNSDTGAWVKMASPATMITVGDIDGDGIDDLIGLWPAQGGIWVKYSQTGAWARLSSTAQYIAAGDMNGDGRDDLIGTWDGQGVYYRNSMNGAWVKMASPATMVTAGDIDGDGTDDLIGLWPTQGGIWVKYSLTGTWARLSSTAQYIAAGDMNGDGRDDLIGTWDGQGVYYRDSMNGVWVKMASPATMVTAGDIDGDGTDDLNGLWPTQGGIWVKYSGDGTWERLSSTARYIVAGKMRAAQGAGALSQKSEPTGQVVEELVLPIGGNAAGPEQAFDAVDFVELGPGGGLFIFIEDINLVPEELASEKAPRIPGPGELNFKWIDQKSQFPQQTKADRSKKEK